MNGVDNSIGARWQLAYRSMHDLDTAVSTLEDCGTSVDADHDDLGLGYELR